MTHRPAESTAELHQRTNDYLNKTLKHLTEVVSALDVLDTAWRLASERDADERAALDAAARRLAALLDGSAVGQ